MGESSTDLQPVWRAFAKRRTALGNLNDGLDIPCMLDGLPDGGGLRALELGCGLGQLAFLLAEQRNYDVVAVDSDEGLLSEAGRLYTGEKIEWVNREFSKLVFSNETFHLIISSLALHFVEDLPSLIGRCAAWLKPDGQLIFSVRHPIRTSNPLGESDQAEEISWLVSRYFEESKREFRWLDENCYNFHRPLSSYVAAIRNSGLSIVDIREPLLTDHLSEKVASESRSVPFFLTFSARKSLKR